MPEGFRETLTEAGLLGCRVLYFEQEEPARFRRPASYPAGLPRLDQHPRPADARGLLARPRHRWRAAARPVRRACSGRARARRARRAADRPLAPARRRGAAAAGARSGAAAGGAAVERGPGAASHARQVARRDRGHAARGRARRGRAVEPARHAGRASQLAAQARGRPGGSSRPSPACAPWPTALAVGRGEMALDAAAAIGDK